MDITIYITIEGAFSAVYFPKHWIIDLTTYERTLTTIIPADQANGCKAKYKNLNISEILLFKIGSGQGLVAIVRLQ